MAEIAGFKYTRRLKAVNTSKFSYDEVVTPGASKPKRLTKNQGKKKPNQQPRHDPNAKTRLSKRRSAEPNEEEAPARTSQDGAKKLRSKRAQKQPQKNKKSSKQRKHAKPTSNAPMYPTKTISSTALREKSNHSANPNKLEALLNEALRCEATHVGETYTDQFSFVLKAVKKVSREFLQTIQPESNGRLSNGIAKNPRNEQLLKKKENLKLMIAQFKKEESDWQAAKQNITTNKENSTQEERLIANVSTAEIDSLQDVVSQSVQGISLQLDTLQKSLVASRHLSDASMQRKDQLSEKFADFTHKQHGNTESPRKLIKSLLMGPTPV